MKRKTAAFFAAISLGCLIAAPVQPAAADQGRAKHNVNRPPPHKGGANNNRRPVKQPNSNRPGNNRPPPQQNRPPNRGNNNRVVAGNTVVVNHGVDRNYHGSYHNDYHHGHWDDDDDDFFEVLGKTAVITAGIGATAAIIGSIVNDEPDNCQQSISNGITYLYCNGTWYQPVMNGSNVQYVVIQDPR